MAVYGLFQAECATTIVSEQVWNVKQQMSNIFQQNDVCNVLDHYA